MQNVFNKMLIPALTAGELSPEKLAYFQIHSKLS